MPLTLRLPVRGSAARSHSLLVTAHRAWWVTVLARSASPIAPLLRCKGLSVLDEARHSLGYMRAVTVMKDGSARPPVGLHTLLGSGV
jgi:hypothetical protein